MYRKIEEELQKWKLDSKKPLMLIGARQTGKTYILNKFCKNNFDNFIYIDLEKEVDVRKAFDNNLDPKTIMEYIQMIKEINFDVDNTVIFFDEIQACERAITSLKYFCEDELPYKIVCAGSLLGIKINRLHSSFPVGKVDMLYMYPFDFEEFLLATENTLLRDKIVECYNNNSPLVEVIHEKALDLYRKYLVLGGMPEPINDFISKNFQITNVNFHLQETIILAYLNDMSKYTENSESARNQEIYKSIPNQLARENNFFKYSIVDKSARRERYESSMHWLLSSNMIYKCPLAEKNQSPFTAFASYEKFKIYLNDTGLLRALSNIDYREILLDKNEQFKGILTENYVACHLYQIFKEIYYYTFDRYEIDFLIKIKGDVIPVEVKSGRRTNSKSLQEYIQKFNPIYSIRISTKNFGMENNIKSIPLYAVFCLSREII